MNLTMDEVLLVKAYREADISAREFALEIIINHPRGAGATLDDGKTSTTTAQAKIISLHGRDEINTGR